MTNEDKLKAILLKDVDFSETQLEDIISYFDLKEIAKKQHLLVVGKRSSDLAFIISGLMYSYILTKDGDKSVLRFAFENSLMGDLSSFFSSNENNINIEAIEDTLCYTLSRDDFEILSQKYPAIEKMFRILFQNIYVESQKRLTSTINDEAKERYLYITEQYSDMIQRVPLTIIASYLGIKLQSLSRIRKEIFAS